jgi:hypothetical protein
MRDFADIAQLDTGTLRSVLETGEAPERVRAAWALALRLGGAIRSELVQDSLTEPHAGVRRHLVVVLAGYQERAVLATLARQDPEAEVRAAACQYLAMLGRPEDTASWRVLHEQLETDASDEVRRACIAFLPPHTPAGLRSAVAARVGDDSLDVRRAAADRLLEWAGLSGDLMPEVLVPRVRLEPDAPLRQELIRRGCALDGGLSLLAYLEDAPETTLGRVLRICAVQGLQFPWELLLPFVRRGEGWLDELLIDVLAAEAPAEAETWLLEVALRYWSMPSPEVEQGIREAASGALEWLASRLEAGHLKEPDEQGMARARELLAALDAALPWVLEVHRGWCDEPEHGECLSEDFLGDRLRKVLVRLASA